MSGKMGFCGLCGRVVGQDSSPDERECSESSSLEHPPSEVYWYVVEKSETSPPNQWKCKKLCGKAICQDLGGCNRQRPAQARKWREWGDKIAALKEQGIPREEWPKFKAKAR